MLDRFHDIEDKLANLEGRLSDPSSINNQQEYQKAVKEHARLSRLAELYLNYKNLDQQISDNRSIIQDESEDPELRDLARLELDELIVQQASLERDIQLFLLPKDPNDDKNIFLEIRAGTGGDEAALFVGDLFRMYSRYAESMGWHVEVVTSSPLGIGGFKEIVVRVAGQGAYSRFKFESGTHRVQRVPETESQGRIHTSACTVAILPEVEDVEAVDTQPVAAHRLCLVDIDQQRAGIDVCRPGV